MKRSMPERRWRTMVLTASTLLTASMLLFILPGVVVAHAELESPMPADGSTVVGQPAEVGGTYSERMDPTGSNLKLKGPDGTVIASGSVDPADATHMSIADLPTLAPGTYTVESTTKSAADGDIDRRTWTFKVTAAASASPTERPTASASPTASATVESASPSASAVPSVAASPSGSPSAPGSPAQTGGSDVLLPILAAIAILVVAAIWFRRRGRTSTRP